MGITNSASSLSAVFANQQVMGTPRSTVADTPGVGLTGQNLIGSVYRMRVATDSTSLPSLP